LSRGRQRGVSRLEMRERGIEIALKRVRKALDYG
jgi:hypothetical protein